MKYFLYFVSIYRHLTTWLSVSSNSASSGFFELQLKKCIFNEWMGRIKPTFGCIWKFQKLKNANLSSSGIKSSLKRKQCNEANSSLLHLSAILKFNLWHLGSPGPWLAWDLLVAWYFAGFMSLNTDLSLPAAKCYLYFLS